MVANVKIGTRGSKLALTQTGQITEQLLAVGGFEADIISVKTDGDVLTGPLSQMGGTGVFAAELRAAVLDGRVDVAVHSLKDLPTAAVPGLTLAAVPLRADARDALCSRDSLKLTELPQGASVGTGSPRRAAQLLAARNDLNIVDIRGNVDTRLARVPGLPGNALADPEPGKVADLDAVVLAASGLSRIGRLDTVTEFLDPEVMLPAPGQGALALECRSAEAELTHVLGQSLAAVEDRDTRLAITAERALLARLEAGCAAPVGALGLRKGSLLHLEAVVVSLDGTRSLRLKKATDGLTTVGATLLGIELAEELLAGGAGDFADLAGSSK